MNSPRSHEVESDGSEPMAYAAPGEADATLRLIAKLPAPEGLEERVHAALRSEPRRARVLAWPGKFGTEHHWARGAAAAAIAFVVVGGGWGVYSRVQPNKVVAMPRVTNQGGFSGANAVRVPQTLDGPVIAHPVLTHPAQTPDGKKDAENKPETKPAKRPGSRVLTLPAQSDKAAQPAVAK